ncbi:aromatic amino acid ammonia-lyase [Sphaerisporangium sp. NPDC005288]|uniref:aromatic amino acid ammonia-lyase n=1 Tax=Sphaerisporangium sp. NPDC005288 TaxID=3155114 RepID=UPI0033B0DA93
MTLRTITLGGSRTGPADIARIARDGAPVHLAADGLERATAAFEAAGEIARRRPVYGRTTGVGANRTQQVAAAEGDAHGLRLLRSHAGGAGALVPAEQARAMMAVRANQIMAGGAGLRPAFAEALGAALNSGHLPQVHEIGAIGTGDLTALAETGLTLIGERPWSGGGRGESPAPIALAAGDALAFCSSSALTIGQATLAWADVAPLLRATQVVAALSLLAVDGNTEPYDERVHAARPHPGSVEVAAAMRRLLTPAPPPARENAPIRAAQTGQDENAPSPAPPTAQDEGAPPPPSSPAPPTGPGQGVPPPPTGPSDDATPSPSSPAPPTGPGEGGAFTAPAARIQDPFGYRCLPQVHGPAVEAGAALERVLDVEINAAAENPLISAAGGTVHHHGGFHQAPLGLALDHLRVALLHTAHLSTARLATLVEPAFTGLRPFLADAAAGSSGVMILEYTASSALAELRNAALPAALGHVVLSRGVEDHAAFASQSARQTLRAASSYRLVLACELVAAVRALRQSGLGPAIAATPAGAAYTLAAARLDPRDEDRPLAPDIETAATLLNTFATI